MVSPFIGARTGWVKRRTVMVGRWGRRRGVLVQCRCVRCGGQIESQWYFTVRSWRCRLISLSGGLLYERKKNHINENIQSPYLHYGDNPPKPGLQTCVYTFMALS